ncbi:MAG: hypothetical protein LBK05_09545 [Treponema sp.]|jgi:flagellar motor component MotA|nr:hypothetical protein [Treponema sp.]
MKYPKDNYNTDQKNTLDYNSLVSEYYKMLLLLYDYSRKSTAEGLLALEEDIDTIDEKNIGH